jgi:hypothetical protein
MSSIAAPCRWKAGVSVASAATRYGKRAMACVPKTSTARTWLAESTRPAM